MDQTTQTLRRLYCNQDDIRQVRDELEDCLAELEFRRQDRVLCTVNALCSEYVYAGFSECFQRGTELVREGK